IPIRSIGTSFPSRPISRARPATVTSNASRRGGSSKRRQKRSSARVPFCTNPLRKDILPMAKPTREQVEIARFVIEQAKNESPAPAGSVVEAAYGVLRRAMKSGIENDVD